MTNTFKGQDIRFTYGRVLQIGANNIGLTSSNQYVQDGLGNVSPLGLSTSGVTVNGSFTVVDTSITVNGHTLTVSNTASISGTSLGTNTGDQTITLTGDVTGTGTGSFATTIANNNITYAKFQQVAASSLVGNATGSLANATGITLGASLSFSGSTLQRAALTGDVTASVNSNATTIANNAVTYAKMQQITGTKLLGSSSGSTGTISEVIVGSGLSLTSGTLAASSGKNFSFNTQIFTSGTGSYIPTSGMIIVKITLVGGGGGSGGISNAGSAGATGGGGAGAVCVLLMTAAQVGASITYLVGPAGAAGAAGANNGTDGGNTSLSIGAPWTAGGGSHSAGFAGTTGNSTGSAGGSGGIVTNGTGTLIYSQVGQAGATGFVNSTSLLTQGGAGGSNQFGAGGSSNTAFSGATLTRAATGFGGGGAGIGNVAVAANTAGSAGTAGIIIIEEFIWA